MFGKMAGDFFPAPKRRNPGDNGPTPPRTGRTNPGPGGSPPGGRRNGSEQSRARPTNRTPSGGDPIGIVTGDVLLSQVDVSLSGVLPLILERTHVSSFQAGRWFGTSWGSTLDQALELDSEGVHFIGADASVRTYPQRPVPNVAFMPGAGPRHPLVLTSAGGYTVTDPYAGRTLHFPAPGEETGWSRLPLTAITDRNGNRIDFLYEEQALTEVRHSGGYQILVDTAPTGDGDRRVTALRTPDGTTPVRFGYDDAGDLTEVYDASGVPQRFTYDAEHRLTGWVDRNEHWYRYTYDERGRAVRGEGSGGVLNTMFVHEPDKRRTLVSDALGNTTVHRYNEYDQIVEETDPLGNVTRSEWDEYDRLLSRTDPLGHTTRFAYDERGNLTDVRYPDGTSGATEFNEFNLPVRRVRPDGRQWAWEYDERGNLARETDPAGAVTTFSHGERGGLVSVTDALGATTRAELDAAGLPTTIIDASGGTSRRVYDAMGRLTGHTDPTGARTTFAWTVEGRPASVTRPDGTVERWRYDGEGNAIEHTDASGGTTRTEYGPLDQPTAVIRPDGSRLAFTHDAERRLATVTNDAGLTWCYTYDPAGRLTAETDFNGRTIAYVLDAAGRLTSRTNGAGQTVAYTRDPLGNTIEKTSGDQVTAFAYDPLGRLIEATGPGGALRLERDALGRVTAETTGGATTAYSRDPLGRVIRRRTPSGAEAVWAYTPTGLPARLATGGQTLTFTHDLAGRETGRRIGASAAMSQQWDSLGRLTAQTLWGAPTSAGDQARLLQHRTYAYRPDGNLTGVTDSLSGDRAYALDTRGRITAVTAHGWTERYTYDGSGNLAHADHPAPDPDAAESGVREYDGTLVRRAGRTRYEHDAQGRIVLRERVTLSGKRRTWRFHWDADDRLTAVETPGGSHWRYHYDPLGRRIAKHQYAPDGGTRLQSYAYAWDGTRLAEQTHHIHARDRPRRITTWTYEPGTHKPLTQTERHSATAPQEWIDQRFHAIVTDLVGTPAELVDPGGAVTPARTSAWGAPATDTPSPCPLRMPGQYHDPETGLHYNFRRYYDPANAGYLSPDPLGLAPQPNPHAYVPNPTTWLDPLGLTPHNYGGSSGQPRVPWTSTGQYDADGHPIDGTKLPTDDALTAAERWVGPGYSEPVPGSGRFVSADGTRVARMGESDITGRHGGGPHMNFEGLAPNPRRPDRMQVIENRHIYID
ncbi:RHS repeat-associated core domain-containing protein [Actinomadura sp. WMMB 499]|uniref:RHS repeat-associated core domain-containing protein n=1 Tax=Actinomadura sp. WMMB 499 TaxID=1219491 RepID=UPI0012463A6B|nr:RHS repeat-associated core domain-containing protein [Actinomadura sp. WMMB 499]QFG20432.1 RHS repeat protein [Actinomadura sp. WMMB 499]